MAKIISIAVDKAIRAQKRGTKFKLKSKQPLQAKRAEKAEKAEKTNEKSENGFSIRGLFFVFLKSRRDDLRYLRTPPHSLERTGFQKWANIREVLR